MSGGVAYVLDDDRALVTRLNEYMVALEAMDAQDMEQLRALVEEHVALTRSAHGQSHPVDAGASVASSRSCRTSGGGCSSCGR